MRNMVDDDGNIIGLLIRDNEPLEKICEKASEIRAKDWSAAFQRADILRHSMQHASDDFQKITEAFGYQSLGGALNHSRLAWFDHKRRRVDVPIRTYQSMCGLGSDTSEKIWWANRLFDMGLKREEMRGEFPDAEFFSRIKKKVKTLAEDYEENTGESIGESDITQETYKTSVAIPLSGNEDLKDQITGVLAYAVGQFLEFLEDKNGMAHFQIEATAFTTKD